MSAVRKISVLVADDSTVVRERLCRLLVETGQFEIVGEAARAIDAWLLAQACQPEAVVLDIQLPDASGLEVLRLIRRARPSCAVVMLTDELSSDYREACRRLGAGDPLLKAREFERVPELLNRLASRTPVATEPPPVSRPPTVTPLRWRAARSGTAPNPVLQTSPEENVS